MIVSKHFNINGKNYVEAAEYDNVLYELKHANDKIAELESELSVKENLLKIKNGLCGGNSDYGKLMQEILSYEPTNKEDDMALFNYHALRSFYEKQDKEENKPNRICEYIQ